MELTLSQKLGTFGVAIPLAILVMSYLLLKFIDLIEDAWRTNHRKKKWLVCLIAAAIIIIRSVNDLFDAL